eukprot:TRINITY_DN6202_c0_g1_i1.p1 TRINITY_DN6202_c0_g1~~TRINITY_DN6202_c0_g1_i1.p1  ORF type:complete len:313 (+),score=73.60 TRINITY_DN6202_c0_g1_i1:46-939(+)
MKRVAFAVLAVTGVRAALVFKGQARSVDGHGASEDPAEPRRTLLRQPEHAGSSDSMVQPIAFDQRLLICNAYPSNSSMVVRKNEREVLADAEHGIAFRECRYVDTRVQSQDKLDMSLAELEVEGTFEVGELPASDAVLLLVLKKRQGSSMVSFQSFAFPPGRGHSEAQVALIDAFQNHAATAPHLKMADHVAGKEKKASLKRVEELSFNRVYAVAQGLYDATIMDKSGTNASEVAATHTRVMRLSPNQNYVILRVGDEELGSAEEIVVYPETDIRSAGLRAAASAIAMLVAAVAMIA